MISRGNNKKFLRMQVRWDPKIKREIKKVLDYLIQEFGVNNAKLFRNNLNSWTNTIISNPYIGKQEPLLIGLDSIYRSVVVHKYQKLIYKIEDDTLYFLDMWDVRRDPQRLIKETP